MSASLETRAEIVKLARLLDVAPDRLAGLAPAGADDVRALREQVTDVLYEGDAASLHAIAAGAKVVPPQVSATVAQRAIGPMLIARLTGVVDAGRAVAVAERLPPEFLAEVAVAMDPRRAADIIVRIPDDKVVSVAEVLTIRREHVAMGRFVGHLDDATIRRCLGVIDDASLLRCGFVLEEKHRLDAVLDLVPDERLEGLIGAAHAEQLWPEALHVFSHVGGRRRAQLADAAAAQAPDRLDGLVRAATRERLWSDLLPLAPVMSEPGRVRFAAAPALREEATVIAVVEAAHAAALWDDLLPIAVHLPADVRAALLGVAADVAGDAVPPALRDLA